VPRSYSYLTEVPLGPRRTPADLKWLLNERAAIAGEHERLQRQASTLESRLQKLDAIRKRLQSNLCARQLRLAQTSELLAALDATVSLAHPEANSEAAGKVNAWAGRYGERGALKAYLRDHIQQSGPQGASTSELIEGAIAWFCLPVTLPTERASVRNSVRTLLRALRRDGLIRPSLSVQPNGARENHWQQVSPLTLAELRNQANPAPGAPLDECPKQNQDFLRGEVACQRAGRSEG